MTLVPLTWRKFLDVSLAMLRDRPRPPFPKEDQRCDRGIVLKPTP